MEISSTRPKRQEFRSGRTLADLHIVLKRPGLGEHRPDDTALAVKVDANAAANGSAKPRRHKQARADGRPGQPRDLPAWWQCRFMAVFGPKGAPFALWLIDRFKRGHDVAAGDLAAEAKARGIHPDTATRGLQRAEMAGLLLIATKRGHDVGGTVLIANRHHSTADHAKLLDHAAHVLWRRRNREQLGEAEAKANLRAIGIVHHTRKRIVMPQTCGIPTPGNQSFSLVSLVQEPAPAVAAPGPTPVQAPAGAGQPLGATGSATAPAIAHPNTSKGAAAPRKLSNGVHVLADAEVQLLLKAHQLDQLRRFHLDPVTGKAVFFMGQDRVVYALHAFAHRMLAGPLSGEMQATGWTLQEREPLATVDLENSITDDVVRPPAGQKVGLRGVPPERPCDMAQRPVGEAGSEGISARPDTAGDLERHAHPAPKPKLGSMAQLVADLFVADGRMDQPGPARVLGAARVHDPVHLLALPGEPDPQHVGDVLAAMVARERRPEHRGGRS